MKKRRPLPIIFLLFLFQGCTRAEGKTVFDFIQYLLSQDTWFRWIVCLLLVYLLLQAWRIIKFSVRYFIKFIVKSHQLLFVWGKRNLIIIAVLGTVLWIFSNPLIDVIQEIEQRYFSPVYINEFGYLSEDHLIAIYEEELSKRVDPYQKKIIIQRSRETGAKINASPLPIYEAAYLECGLNPFTVRSDLVAAGWIQFTRAGLGGLRYRGKPVAFDDVLTACRIKDIEFMMDISELYLVDKFERSGRKPLNNTIDLYLALFAPALIGSESSRVIYQGYDNPSYYKNDGLDGWYVTEGTDGKKQIFHKRSQRDGKITIWEVYLALEAKKAKLINAYLK